MATSSPPMATSLATRDAAGSSGCASASASKRGSLLLVQHGGVGELGVLERVGRERHQRLDLAHRDQPAGDGRSEAPPPDLDRQRELRRPQQRRGQDHHDLVAARVQQVDQPRQLRHATRRCDRIAAAAGVTLARSLQRAPQLDEQRRRERFTLEAREQQREQLQLAGAPIGVEQDRLDHGAQLHRPADAQQSRADHREQPDPARQPRDDHSGDRDAQRRRHRARSRQPERQARLRDRRRRRPRGQRPRIDVQAQVEALHRQVLLEVQARRQLGHRLLARANHRRGGRALQPVGERLLAHRRARRGQPLVERPDAEQVEVRRVDVVLVREARAAAVPGGGRSSRRAMPSA